ncbi:hypothetical protein SD77_4067 [Bacillus badius]|uniref:Ribose 5-phosphate isomerase B n=1 Tax=Bacillus badius TaxID=1455 RepID=A0ABR5AUE8_BACBA|nr:hypothetical protein SD78_0373 [Bacillus badius]KIL78387.1 hypothetical protein SD77_4067 [Bacillus badius]
MIVIGRAATGAVMVFGAGGADIGYCCIKIHHLYFKCK